MCQSHTDLFQKGKAKRGNQNERLQHLISRASLYTHTQKKGSKTKAGKRVYTIYIRILSRETNTHVMKEDSETNI